MFSCTSDNIEEGKQSIKREQNVLWNTSEKIDLPMIHEQILESFETQTLGTFGHSHRRSDNENERWTGY